MKLPECLHSKTDHTRKTHICISINWCLLLALRQIHSGYRWDPVEEKCYFDGYPQTFAFSYAHIDTLMNTELNAIFMSYQWTTWTNMIQKKLGGNRRHFNTFASPTYVPESPAAITCPFREVGGMHITGRTSPSSSRIGSTELQSTTLNDASLNFPPSIPW